MTTANKWIIEAAGLVDWNPAWTIEEINDKKVVVEVQMEKLCHLVKRYLKEEHPSIYDQIESKSLNHQKTSSLRQYKQQLLRIQIL